jgi:hypothetical protein
MSLEVDEVDDEDGDGDAEDLEDALVDALDDEGDDEGDLPEGFTVVGPAVVDGPHDGDEALGRTVVPTVDDDDRAAAVLEAAARGGADSDEDDDEDDLAVQRAGEFVCSRCRLVKRDTQLARPRLLICRDCA